MRALTVRQPWATLLVLGLKPVENRSWALPAKMRGETVAIHAAKAVDAEGARWLLQHAAVLGIDVDALGELPTGAVVGAVRLVDDVTAMDSPWFFGPHGFVVREPVALSRPIACAGKLGFWHVPSDIEAEVARQMAEQRERLSASG